MSRSDVQILERKVRRLKLYVLSATLVLGVLALAALGPASESETFGKIEAERIDIVGPDGNEMGGMGAVDVEGRARQTLLIFDYQNSEAIGYSAGETGDGDHYKASLTIADRVPWTQTSGR